MSHIKKNIHVVGAVIVKDGKVLCAQRSPDKTLPYKWEFPGGKIEKGESPQKALNREIKEEMQCSVIVGAEIAFTVYEYDFGIVHLATFYCKMDDVGQLKPTEHTAIKWVLPKELNLLDWAPADIPTVEKIEVL